MYLVFDAEWPASAQVSAVRLPPHWASAVRLPSLFLSQEKRRAHPSYPCLHDVVHGLTRHLALKAYGKVAVPSGVLMEVFDSQDCVDMAGLRVLPGVRPAIAAMQRMLG